MPDFAKDLEIASDSSTEPEILATLERSPDPTIREALVSNPNTPAEVLLRLGAEFPAQLLDNPLLILLILENPNLVDEIPLQTLQSLLQQQNAPAYLWERAGDRADIEAQLARTERLDTSATTLKRLMQSKDERVSQAASLHVNAIGELGEDWRDKLRVEFAKAASTSNFWGHYGTCIDPLPLFCQIPAPVADYWLCQPNSSNFCEAIASLVADPALMMRLGNYPNSSVRYRVLMNPRITAEVAAAIELDDSYKLKAASEWAISPYFLAKLSVDPDPKVRQIVARNRNLPRSLLYDL